MADALVLDSEALSSLAHARERPAAAARAAAILSTAHERRALVRVPAPVLAEVCRGTKRDAAIMHVLRGKGVEVVPLTEGIARAAGALLEAHDLDSCHAVDAFVVATAAHLGGGVIATGDPVDLGRLAAADPRIRIWAI